MIWNAARGGMRSVVEAYLRDGFAEDNNVVLISSYSDGGFLYRQLLLIRSVVMFVWYLLTSRIELVHCHAATRGSFWRKALFANLARAKGIPVLLHLHGSEMKEYYATQPAWIRNLIIRELTAATAVIVLSESWKDYIFSTAPRSRPVVVPNYVRIPPPFSRSVKSTVDILFLGVIGKRKGVYDLLRAMSDVQRVCPHVRLVVAGNGKVEQARELAASLGLLEAVQFPGWVDDVQKTQLLRYCDIYVLPSHNENLPVSVLEAMSFSLPVVTTRVGGLPDLLTDNVDAILIDAGDTAALRNALVLLAEDPALRVRLGKAAFDLVRRSYSDSAVLPVLTKLYEEVTR
jgi:glycosyltransferase involved in cell wall biosynthesis